MPFTPALPALSTVADPAVRQALAEIARVPVQQLYGRISSVLGLLLECRGLQRVLSVGSRCTVIARGGRHLACEVVGFRNDRALLMPFDGLEGVGLGCKVLMTAAEGAIHPDVGWLGRVVNALGEPIDGKGPLAYGPTATALRTAPSSAACRPRTCGSASSRRSGSCRTPSSPA